MKNDTLLKGLLIVGFLALFGSAMIAAATPATGYELSIYRSTPIPVWAGLANALLAALLAAYYGRNHTRDAGLLLAATTGVTVLSMPVIRGYAFQGAADSLTHLGWVRMLSNGSATPFDLLYPGTHSIAVFIHTLTGVPTTRAVQYMVLVFAVVYLVFIPLCVRAIANTELAVVTGVFSALLFLPINHVGIHTTSHPTSQAVMFLPFVLYLLLSYATDSESRLGLGALTPIGAVFALTSIAIVLIHPQEALNVLIVLTTVSAVQIAARRFRPNHSFSGLRPLYAQALFLLMVFAVWAPRNDTVQRWIRVTAESLLAGSTATELTSRTSSLQALGATIEVLFLKLFFVSLVFSLLAGVLLLASVTGRLDDVFPYRNAFNKYLAAAMVPLFVAFAVVFTADLGDHYFRYLGFIMVFVTVVGAVAVSVGIPRLLHLGSTPTVRRATLALFVLLFPLTMVALHPSPYIYQPSPQVTEMELDGYETAFEQRDTSIEYLGIREGPRRYVDAIYGPTSAIAADFPGKRDEVDETAFRTDLVAADNEDKYFTVTSRDVNRELALYDGFRFPQAGFRSLETTPGINRVQTNGDFELYFLSRQDRA